ncbi:hypothetical protein [Paenibacillus macquariensis]|uniref:Uncharacterized protein n=1 Tax=Paenibacillus macquariensis TaxID=948756 RepID=A0ABY1KD79_9BACL|nr:hypothetical protein [Paenibacillus macquariensis]MEC0094319.1 hypothetical protein [Paenibacillus macquariensis]OAB26341.1 hypothetical protein PMSM_26925 [Paenibacillus macquariensis subsp. macquariensis]SIR64308.1 hypothetical protein SAMN05421578_12615 [Paenibacillus macquariensis]
MMPKISRKEFEEIFKEVNASMDFEDAALNDREKSLLYRRLNDEISDEEYIELFLKDSREGSFYERTKLGRVE